MIHTELNNLKWWIDEEVHTKEINKQLHTLIDAEIARIDSTDSTDSTNSEVQAAVACIKGQEDNPFTQGCECKYCKAYRVIVKAALTAYRTEPWVPVSEELPNNGRVVLLQFSNALYPIVGYYSKTYECFMSIGGGSYPLSLGVRWMPLESEAEK